jgi:hypothetical protein
LEAASKYGRVIRWHFFLLNFEFLSLRFINFFHCSFQVKVKPISGPEGSRRFRLFRENRQINVVKLSALRTGCLYPRKFPWYSCLLEPESTPGSCTAGRIMSMKNSSDTIGNRTRDLPARSAVPQPTTPPRAPQLLRILVNKYSVSASVTGIYAPPSISKNRV